MQNNTPRDPTHLTPEPIAADRASATPTPDRKRKRARRHRGAVLPPKLCLERHVDRLLEWYRIERAIIREALRQEMRQCYKTISRRRHRVHPTAIWAEEWDAPLETGPLAFETGYEGEVARPLADIRWRITILYAEGDGGTRRSRWGWGSTWRSSEPPPREYLAFGAIKDEAATAYQERFLAISALRAYYHELRARFVPVLLGWQAITADRPSWLPSATTVRTQLSLPADTNRYPVRPLDPGPRMDAITRRLLRRHTRMRQREGHADP